MCKESIQVEKMVLTLTEYRFANRQVYSQQVMTGVLSISTTILFLTIRMSLHLILDIVSTLLAPSSVLKETNYSPSEARTKLLFNGAENESSSGCL